MKSHQKKYYGSLFVIMVLIVGTAIVLTNDGNDGSKDLVGMATAATVEEGGSFLFEYLNAKGELTKQVRLEYDAASKEYTLTDYSGPDTIVTRNSDFATVANYAMNLGTQGQDTKIIVGVLDKSGENVEEKTYALSTTERKTYGWPSTEFGEYTTSTSSSLEVAGTIGTSKAGEIKTFDYIEDTNTLTVTVGAFTYKYNIVEIDGEYYAEKTSGETKFYTDEKGVIWKYDDEKLVKTGGTESLFLSKDDQVLPVFSALMQSKVEKQTAAKKMEAYQKTAAEIGGGVTGEDLYGEETAINAYLSEKTKGVTYDVTSGHYEGTMEYGGAEYDVKYHNDDVGVLTSVPQQKGDPVNKYVYKDTSTIPPRYYTVDDKEKETTVKIDESTKSDIRKAEHAVEDVEEDIQQEMQKCAKAKSDAECQLTYTTDDGTTIRLDATARQEAFMNRMYAEQEAKVQGLIAGWLNGWLDEKLGGWSRGVPAGICANIFGLEYYKQDGWTRVTMNASVDQLQSQLIANSRTVIIEGEKEEITEDMFRYAYTVKLLANQSVEWQTYLYNSCTGETSVDTFYDYGSLLAGGYFAFHYAGAGAQDMIFECDQEICLYDQACVVFADGTAPTCVSLVHGAGFETPLAGNDYDCAITG